MLALNEPPAEVTMPLHDPLYPAGFLSICYPILLHSCCRGIRSTLVAKAVAWHRPTLYVYLVYGYLVLCMFSPGCACTQAGCARRPCVCCAVELIPYMKRLYAFCVCACASVSVRLLASVCLCASVATAGS